MKTPEEMAEEYCEENDECEFARDAFLAGYRAHEKKEKLKLAELYSHGSEVQQIAAQYVKQRGTTGPMAAYAENRFIDGYQAAKDQLADAGKVMDTCEHILEMDKMVDVNSSNNSNGWISVMERLPEISEHGYSEDVLLLSEMGRMEVSHIERVKRVVTWRGIQPVIETGNGTPIQNFTHWMPLPEAPKEEG